MKILLFALKKTLKTPIYWIFFAAALLLPPLFFALGRQAAVPPAGFVLEGERDREASRIAAYLKDSGFLSYPDRRSLEEDVAAGELDAGIVIPEGITGRLEKGQFEKCLIYISAPTSAFPDLWKEHAVSALYAVCAPYISAAILEEAGIPRETLFDAYWTRMDAGKLFSFRLTTREGALSVSRDRSERFFLFGLSLLLFLGSWFCVASPLSDSVRLMAPRIGRFRAFVSLYLPGLLLRFAGLFAAAAAACLLAGEARLILSAGLYLLLLHLFSLLLACLPGSTWKDTLLFFTAVFSLALCPVYLDFALIWPPVSLIRSAIPPFWLWMLAGMA